MRFKPRGGKNLFFKPGSLLSEKWRSLIGKDYDLALKTNTLVPFLSDLDRRGLLGKSLLDVGSGSVDIICAKKGLLKGAGLFYDASKRKVVRVDISFFEESQRGNIFEIPLDIEEIPSKKYSVLKKIVKAKRFLGSNSVDTILFSDILNYVDYKKVIKNAKDYLKSHGLIIIFNKPDRGFQSFFSPNGVKSNADLLSFLKGLDFDLVHCARLGSVFPTIEKVGSLDHIIVVAKKK